MRFRVGEKTRKIQEIYLIMYRYNEEKNWKIPLSKSKLNKNSLTVSKMSSYYHEN